MTIYHIEDPDGERAEFEALERRLEEALGALEGMVETHCGWPGRRGLQHHFLADNEKAFEVLVAAGRLRRVEGPPELYLWVTQEERVGAGGPWPWATASEEPRPNEMDTGEGWKVHK